MTVATNVVEDWREHLAIVRALLDIAQEQQEEGASWPLVGHTMATAAGLARILSGVAIAISVDMQGMPLLAFAPDIVNLEQLPEWAAMLAMGRDYLANDWHRND